MHNDFWWIYFHISIYHYALKFIDVEAQLEKEKDEKQDSEKGDEKEEDEIGMPESFAILYCCFP